MLLVYWDKSVASNCNLFNLVCVCKIQKICAELEVFDATKWSLSCGQILRWMLLRLRPREFDSIKQYVAELLAVLMQGGEANLRAMGETGGIDCLLEGVALFKSRLVLKGL